MAMRGPVLAEHGKGPRRKWNVTIFGSLTTVNVNHHPLTVDVTDLEVQTFLETQPE